MSKIILEIEIEGNDSAGEEIPTEEIIYRVEEALRNDAFEAKARFLASKSFQELDEKRFADSFKVEAYEEMGDRI